MYCNSCGNKIESTDGFCTNCGVKLENKKIEKEKKQKHVIWIILSLAAVILCIIVMSSGISNKKNVDLKIKSQESVFVGEEGEHSIRYEADKNGYFIYMEDSETGEKINMVYEYDEDGRPIMMYGYTQENELVLAEKYEYRENERMLAKCTYNVLGSSKYLVKIEERNSEGQILKVSNYHPEGELLMYTEYNEMGKEIRTENYIDGELSDSVITEYGYIKRDLLPVGKEEFTKENGTVRYTYEYEYDWRGKVVAYNVYNENGILQERMELLDGNVITEYLYSSDGSVARTMEYKYNKYGKCILQRWLDENGELKYYSETVYYE